jgi:hypothetical protein
MPLFRSPISKKTGTLIGENNKTLEEFFGKPKQPVKKAQPAPSLNYGLIQFKA